jgi:tetrahydromethanopterin S-methyltransferase subunit G
MADMITEERLTVSERENVEIKRRLATLEGSFEFISRPLKSVQTYTHNRFEQINRRFGQVDKRFERVEKRLDRIETDVAGLRGNFSGLHRDLPGIVGDVMRQVLKESRS